MWTGDLNGACGSEREYDLIKVGTSNVEDFIFMNRSRVQLYKEMYESGPPTLFKTVSFDLERF